jgi:hypothetical protein
MLEGQRTKEGALPGAEQSGPERHPGVWVAFGLVLALVIGGVAWAALRHPGTPSSAAMGRREHTMPMPAADTEAPGFAVEAGVGDAYLYAAQNYNVLRYVPCTCGCVDMGHLDNFNCYVRNVDADGIVEWDQHAAGCQVCIDITRDVMDMRARGTPLSEIRGYIDANYTGPATDTILPPAA